jgi:hypothetical protein
MLYFQWHAFNEQGLGEFPTAQLAPRHALLSANFPENGAGKSQMPG